MFIKTKENCFINTDYISMMILNDKREIEFSIPDHKDGSNLPVNFNLPMTSIDNIDEVMEFFHLKETIKEIPDMPAEVPPEPEQGPEPPSGPEDDKKHIDFNDYTKWNIPLEAAKKLVSIMNKKIDEFGVKVCNQKLKPFNVEIKDINRISKRDGLALISRLDPSETADKGEQDNGKEENKKEEEEDSNKETENDKGPSEGPAQEAGQDGGGDKQPEEEGGDTGKAQKGSGEDNKKDASEKSRKIVFRKVREKLLEEAKTAYPGEDASWTMRKYEGSATINAEVQSITEKALEHYHSQHKINSIEDIGDLTIDEYDMILMYIEKRDTLESWKQEDSTAGQSNNNTDIQEAQGERLF